MNRQEIWKKTVLELSGLLDADESGLFVILEDTSRASRDYLRRNETFAKKFSEQISVQIFTNDELVTFARSYSRNLDTKLMIWRFWHCITGSAIFRTGSGYNPDRGERHCG